jgi:hypothetical protein
MRCTVDKATVADCADDRNSSLRFEFYYITIFLCATGETHWPHPRECCGMCTRAMDDTGLASLNSGRQNTKSQNLVILDPKNGDFDKLYLHHGPVGTRGDSKPCRPWPVLFAGAHVLRGAAWSSLVNTNFTMKILAKEFSVWIPYTEWPARKSLAKTSIGETLHHTQQICFVNQLLIPYVTRVNKFLWAIRSVLSFLHTATLRFKVV